MGTSKLSQHFRALEVFSGILCLLLAFVSFGCDGSSYQADSGAGTVSFQISWQTDGTPEAAAVPLALNCQSAGVAQVEATIYDGSNHFLVGGGPWNCPDHTGTISGVSEGSNRRIVVLGTDYNGFYIYRGEKKGFTVVANQDNSAGVIVTYSFVPTGGSYNSSKEDCSWNSVVNITSYELQVAEDDAFENIVINALVNNTTSDTLTGLSYDTTYYCRVRAVDFDNHKSAWSEIWNFYYKKTRRYG